MVLVGEKTDMMGCVDDMDQDRSRHLYCRVASLAYRAERNTYILISK
jgi:hypothetical protein